MDGEANHERNTADPVDPETLAADVDRIFETLGAGGVAVVGLDVAYAIIAQREAGIRKIFAAKNRSYEKPSGMFGDYILSSEIHIMDADRHAMARSIIETDKLPFSIVAPFRADHPVFASVDPFVLGTSSKGGTLDMLLNAGQLHNAIAKRVRETGRPVFGSSANTSLAGSKYRLADVEAPVRDAASLHLDYGVSKYANPLGRSSTIIDFGDFSVIRIGVCYDRLEAIFADRFGVKLQITERTAR